MSYQDLFENVLGIVVVLWFVRWLCKQDLTTRWMLYVLAVGASVRHTATAENLAEVVTIAAMSTLTLVVTARVKIVAT